MLRVGDYNRLEIAKEVDFGLYLNSDEGEILLPQKYVPEGVKIGDYINVFIYTDSEDRLIATTLEPKAVVEDFAAMKVKQVSNYGAFLDWGLEKDLLVPFKEQNKRLQEGETTVVKVCLDPRTNRVIGVGKIEAFINKDSSGLSEGQKVELLIYGKTDLGFKAIIDDEYAGVIYKNEVFEDLKIGDRKEGYIKKIREDGKVDLALQKQGYKAVGDFSVVIIEELESAGGFLPFHDKSDPEEIQEKFKMSKKSFKKAVGSLYRQGAIRLDDKGIYLNASD